MSKNQISFIAQDCAGGRKLCLTNVNIADSQFQAFRRKWLAITPISVLGVVVWILWKGNKLNSITQKFLSFFLSANSIKSANILVSGI